ncbi:MAG: hypothetical protein PUF72_02705 [Clostridiales bacterium]|nr:hypothetical protein [Clostridiales bacterium]
MKNMANVLLSVCILLISLILIMISAALFEFFPIDWAVLLVVLSSITFIIALAAAILLDYGAGVYECKKCGRTFKPTLGEYVWGAHTITRKYLKCPHCKEKSFCKRRLSGLF